MVSRSAAGRMSSSPPHSGGAGKSLCSNKDLLQLEAKASALERRLQVCTNGAGSLRTRCFERSEPPTIGPIPESSVLGRVKEFLPVLDEANRKLMSDIEERGVDEFNVELVAGPDDHYVEMNIALGVYDLYTPEALAAAESAADGQVLRIENRTVASSENSDSSSEDEDEDPSNRKGRGSLLDVTNSRRGRRDPDSDREENPENKAPFKRKKIELL